MAAWDPFWSFAFGDLCAPPMPAAEPSNSSIFPDRHRATGKDCRGRIAGGVRNPGDADQAGPIILFLICSLQELHSGNATDSWAPSGNTPHLPVLGGKKCPARI